jgi:ATP-dependent Lon protease
MSQKITAQNRFEAEPRCPRTAPVLALKDMVAFPFMIAPLFVTRDASVAAIEDAIARDRMVLLTAQRSPSTEDPRAEDLYWIGTVGVLMRMFKLPDQRIRILVQGICRARVLRFDRKGEFLTAEIENIEEPPEEAADPRARAVLQLVKDQIKAARHLEKSFPPEALVVLENLEDPGRLADLIASNLRLSVAQSQSVLEAFDPLDRLLRVHDILSREAELLDVQEKINTQARGEIDKNQKEYFLRQQLKAIQTELGETDQLSEELDEYRRRIGGLRLSAEAGQEAARQVNRLERLQADSAEAALVRNYLDWLVSLPWGVTSHDNLDLRKARRILDSEHYDLEEVKTRILEYLAVLKLKRNLKGPILCFLGPPGVGKTSLGRAIAKALGRKFVRASLGGVHDEAEIRGHRRTYVGAMPGKIIQALRQAESENPVFLLDEVDKMSADARGDPAAALLEVLDSEQNFAFRDNFLGVPFDLSRVLFIATANVLDTIRPAFRDRMEVLPLPGYTEEEKLRIARRHLVKRQIETHGLTPRQLKIADSALRAIIEGYTNEAGVRNLERELASVCRKVARKVAEGEDGCYRITRKEIPELLGPPRKSVTRRLSRDSVGVATSLAWTPTGGEVLFIESTVMPGKGRLITTGQLGEVMRESARAAMSYARSRAAQLGLDLTLFARMDLHIHVPEGAIPKDGPSAGIALAVSLISAYAQAPVCRDLAFMGEITLRGAVLPVGGVKEKVLAAQRSRIHRIVLPIGNQQDLREVPDTARGKLEFLLVGDMDEVIRLAFRRWPVARQSRAFSDQPGEGAASPLRMRPKARGA